MQPGRPTRLESRLTAGRFAITAELAPPHGTDTDRILAMADRLSPGVDAFNVTDNQNARLRLSPVTLGHLLAERGHEVVLQVTCRDRNRLAIQSELLGAWRLGLRNVLALTGDHMGSGDHPEAKPVFDLDSLTLIRTVGRMAEGFDLVDRPLAGAPAFFCGAAVACDQSPRPLALLRFRKKIRAGARFFQTQAIFHPASVLPFVEIARNEGVFLLGGIFIMHSRKVLEHIVNKVPGLLVPDEVRRRLESAGDVAAEGVEVAAEAMRELAATCHGVHIMTAGREELIEAVIRKAGIPRPRPDGG
jgi:5,10-methylenetetrahydrofolate reductase